MKYILTSPKFEGEISLEYSLNGYLTAYRSTVQLNKEQLDFLSKNFPLNSDKLQELLKKSKTMVLKEVAADLSFDNLWNTYGYKVGKKPKAEKLWNALSEADKLQVFENIKAYNYYLTIKQNQDKQYLETYLRNRTFETNWKELLRK